MSSECDVEQRFYDAYHLSEFEGKMKTMITINGQECELVSSEWDIHRVGNTHPVCEKNVTYIVIVGDNQIRTMYNLITTDMAEITIDGLTTRAYVRHVKPYHVSTATGETICHAEISVTLANDGIDIPKPTSTPGPLRQLVDTLLGLPDLFVELSEVKIVDNTILKKTKTVSAWSEDIPLFCDFKRTNSYPAIHWNSGVVPDEPQVTNCILVDEDEVKPFIDWRNE